MISFHLKPSLKSRFSCRSTSQRPSMYSYASTMSLLEMLPAGCAGADTVAEMNASAARTDLFMAHFPSATKVYSIHCLRLRKFPFATQDFVARAIQPHHVVPPLYRWQAILILSVATTELDGDRAVRCFLCGDAIE